MGGGGGEVGGGFGWCEGMLNIFFILGSVLC